MSRFLGRDESAGEAASKRSSAADLDAEGDGQVDRQATHARRIAEQRVERFQVVPEGLSRLLEPGENATIALIERPARRSDLEP